MKTRLLFTIVLALTTAVAAQTPRPPAKASIAQVAWIAGTWSGGAGGATFEERWTPPAGGAMLGMSRTVKDGSLAEFEYLRIVQKGDELLYIAHPGGRAPGTEFKMTSLTEGAAGYHRAVFENPDHDFPKRILYVRRADGTLVATVDAGQDTKAVTYEYRNMATGAPSKP